MRETRDPEKPDIVFHYNRARRLAHAPESVRRAYEQGPVQRPGLIRGLVATPGLRSIFFVIILLSAIITGITIFGTPQGHMDVSGIPVQLKAFHFDENVYFTLNFSDTQPDSAAVIHAEVSALNEADVILDVIDLNGIYTGKALVLRGIFPDHGISFLETVVTAGNLSATTRVSVDRK